MTVININKDYIEISGHSGYAPRGYDIVCAAISTLSISTFNYLLITDNDVKVKENDGYLKMELLKLNKVGKKIIKCFKKQMNDLIEDYPQYITRRYK